MKKGHKRHPQRLLGRGKFRFPRSPFIVLLPTQLLRYPLSAANNARPSTRPHRCEQLLVGWTRMRGQTTKTKRGRGDGGTGAPRQNHGRGHDRTTKKNDAQCDTCPQRCEGGSWVPGEDDGEGEREERAHGHRPNDVTAFGPVFPFSFLCFIH
jgi:hypothetical protein